MFVIREEIPPDVPEREAFLDACFGPTRFAKTCERLRANRRPTDGLSLVVERDGALVATMRFWHVEAGSAGAALLLGPVAVTPQLQGLGLGSKLIRDGLGRAAAFGHRAVVLVGDEPYYRRFDFTTARVGGLWLPGPRDSTRFLGLDLVPGALDGAAGLVSATGVLESGIEAIGTRPTLAEAA